MRKPFSIEIGHETYLVWKEIGWGDGLPLHRFFRAVHLDRAEKIASEDGNKWSDLSWKERASYRKESSDIMFTLLKFPPINQTLPLVAASALPNILRFRQSPGDIGKGLLGLHIGLLWHKASNEILGVATLEKTKEFRVAELAYWKYPNLSGKMFRNAILKFMLWSQKTAGYRDFIGHIEAKDVGQRGNESSAVFVEKLGFEMSGIRQADDPDGNGKKTLIFRAYRWSPANVDLL